MGLDGSQIVFIDSVFFFRSLALIRPQVMYRWDKRSKVEILEKPMYVFFRLVKYLLLKLFNNGDFKVWSTSSISLNIFNALAWCSCAASVVRAFALAEMIGLGPELRGHTKETLLMVLYTISSKVRPRRPCLLSLSVLWMALALALSFHWYLW